MRQREMMARRMFLLLAVALAGCRNADAPAADMVKRAAESLFERAVRGESVSGIQFTGGGTATPRLISSEIRARRRAGSGFEYEVRLTYLDRIQQMEWATVTVLFERRGKGWEGRGGE